jgi:hypothetical protein
MSSVNKKSACELSGQSIFCLWKEHQRNKLLGKRLAPWISNITGLLVQMQIMVMKMLTMGLRYHCLLLE